VQKINIVIVIVCVFLIASILSGFIFFRIGNVSGFNRGIGAAGDRETELIGRIEEYRKREVERTDRERERNRRERERIEATNIRLERLAGLSGGTITEIQKLREVYNIMADFYNSTRSDNTLWDNYDSSDGE